MYDTCTHIQPCTYLQCIISNINSFKECSSHREQSFPREVQVIKRGRRGGEGRGGEGRGGEGRGGEGRGGEGRGGEGRGGEGRGGEGRGGEGRGGEGRGGEGRGGEGRGGQGRRERRRKREGGRRVKRNVALRQTTHPPPHRTYLGHSMNQSMVQQLTREGNMRHLDLKASPTGLMHRTM